MRKFSQQPPPRAVAAPPRPQPRPVDLTSSLLQSNLTQLTSSPLQPANMNQRLTSPNYNISQPNQPFGYQNQNAPTGFDTQLALPPATGWSPASGNFNNKWANGQNQNVKQDWSAFESLLPSQQNNNQNSNNNVKKLTSSEMMDLLS